MTKKDWKRVCVCMDPLEYKYARLQAAEIEISVSAYIRSLIRSHLEIEKYMQEKLIAKPFSSSE